MSHSDPQLEDALVALMQANGGASVNGFLADSITTSIQRATITAGFGFSEARDLFELLAVASRKMRDENRQGLEVVLRTVGGESVTDREANEREDTDG